MSASATETRYVGASIPRVEDARILTGQGHYVGDLQRPGMLEAAFVRSPIAHGRILSVDATRALAMPGVVAVITGRDVETDTAPFTFPMETPGVTRPVFHALSAERVRHVGDPVAIVIAENRYLAEDAREAVHLEYEQLPPVLGLADAEAEGPAMYAELDSNVLHRDVRSFGDPDGAFAAADAVVRHSVRMPRVLHSPMDTRGGLAEYDAATGQLVFHTTSQSPHVVWFTLAHALRHPFERIRVLVPDMGGAFGQKANPAREDVALCYAARRLGRPVRWIEDRTANLTAAPSGRGEQLAVDAAVRRDGTILALDGHAVLDHGAYLVPFPTHLQAALMRTILPASYRIEHLRFAEVHLLTNRPMWAPLRGPWGIEALARETLIDEIARELALDPADVRRRNLVAYDEQPYIMVSGPTLEGSRAVEAFDCALEAIGYDELRREQATARASGRLLGVGLASYIEPAPGPPDLVPALDLPGGLPERMNVRLEPDGGLSVFTSQIPHGQGHETTLAQVAADALGVPLDRVKIEWGDTRTTPFNQVGTGASRAAAMSTGAIVAAVRTLRGKILGLAGAMLEIAPEDLDLVDGVVVSPGNDAIAVPLGHVAAASYFMPPEGEDAGLRSVASYHGARGGWSGGTHACLVEVDPETGVVDILRYAVGEDCGHMINPAIVEGQIRGGVAQGIGLALLEDARYDDDGGFLADTYHSYLLPNATSVPRIDIAHVRGAPLHDADFRGVGEGGMIAAPPAVANAVADAIGAAGPLELPLSPNRVLDLLDRIGR